MGSVGEAPGTSLGTPWCNLLTTHKNLLLSFFIFYLSRPTRYGCHAITYF